MTGSCRCDRWKIDFDKINAMKISFLFCPWCGLRLTAPCHICEAPSNTHTGNTLYWYEEKNFCSATCARKLDMSFARKET